jgi:hypothetical protein
VISTQGCAIEGAEGLSVGKKCELYVDWRGAQIGAQAQIASKDEEGGIGLKFLSVDKDTRKRLSDLCDTLRIQSLSTPPPKEVETDRYVPDSVTEPQLVSVEAPPSAAPAPERERRRVPRYISDLPARVTDPATGASWSVTLVTLSILGGCLEGPELPPAGQQCEVNTEWDGMPLRLPGEVVWKSKEKEVGVKFATLDEEAEKLLRQVCANLRLQPLAPLPPGPE